MRLMVPVVVLAVLVTAGCTKLSGKVPASAAAPVVPAGFVRSDGTRLTVDGKPYFFTGMNIYNAADDASQPSRACWYRMGSGDTLAASLRALGPGVEVFRVWFFQNQATDGNGKRDWESLDHTLAVARANGKRVIPVLVNQWGNCEGKPGNDSGYKNEAWYRSGYRTDVLEGTAVPYREWVRQVVGRYRSDPTILAWQLVNEAEDAVSYGGDCTPTAAATLVGFVTDMAALVKSLDPAHLLSLGTLGSGQCGTRGAEYQQVYAVQGNDLCDYHDYDPAHPVPGDQWNGMAVRLRECNSLGKPLITSEIGLRPHDGGGTFDGRARLLDTKLHAQREAGVAGALVWAWRDGAHGGSAPDDFYVGPGDPLLKVLGTY